MNEGDYVANTRNDGPGNIKQMMSYGNDTYLQEDLEKITRNYHELTISELLDVNYLKMKIMARNNNS
ncbi:MAG: hypothetical protein ACK4ND_08840 [Cytophagaceae bacterium]